MISSPQGTLGIDFGTSNSAMAWADPLGEARHLCLEGQATAMPTAVFYNSEDLSTHFGRDAVAQYLGGTPGRLMRSLKSLLGSPLLLETTVINHRQVSFQDIIATFLATLRERATESLGASPRRVVMGRPVHFVDDDPLRDAQAEASLRQAAQSVGFDEVTFQLEPIAAALDYERRLQRESVVLVVDIGGGTSDFTVVRLGPQRVTRPERVSDILATTGVHIGGTDFDQKLSLEQLMPMLGYRHLGPQQREVPSRIFFDLSTWHLINWLYQSRALSQARELRSNYADPHLHQRLMKVLNHRLGHQMAHELELAKIRCSDLNDSTAVDLSFVEPGFVLQMTPEDMQAHLASLLGKVVACARDCVLRAGISDAALDAIYLTGGSSALRPFQAALRAEFPGVPLVEGDLFGGVAAGLAYSQVRA
ncbi:Hsp70 family protein [Rhodoferax fermentans]|uniref:Heat-shock protein n=1 Tax=Rhodoferax fermentans TaxID=28066 RepID=A0A1T1AQZ9_RHOFE|nr:Hsp70 family protein [Rhodoferax fermentans]MBK1684650.1 Hsp70 family protein [Rhodoferax fermentans]OOV06507.1 heat-shock protein [Rhodoferax fermentans]